VRLDRIAVVRRVVHVVVEAVPLHAVTPRGVEVRRLPNPGIEKHLGVLIDLHHRSLPPDSSSPGSRDLRMRPCRLNPLADPKHNPPPEDRSSQTKAAPSL